MMTNGEENTLDQRTTVERLLDDEQVLVHINPMAPGVLVPDHLGRNQSVTLRLSRFFRGELVTDEERVSADLLFGDQYFTCLIPWNSIWGASSVKGEEFLWAEAAPPQIIDIVMAQQEQLRASAEQKKHSPTPPPPKRRGDTSHLRRVK